jgi:hypothetical protein
VSISTSVARPLGAAWGGNDDVAAGRLPLNGCHCMVRGVLLSGTATATPIRQYSSKSVGFPPSTSSCGQIGAFSLGYV